MGRIRQLGVLLGPSAVIVLAAAVRLHGLDALSLSLDESTLLETAKGVMARGYPFLYVGSIEVQLATYELVPYFIALSLSLLGLSDFSVRVPSALFGIGTTIVLVTMGRKWFDWRVGLLAGLLYGLSPWAIHWAQNSFHPSQSQFFVLLTVLQAHRLLSNDRVPVRTYYLAALFFSCAYLSWEGSGFVLPILACVALVMRWGKWDWLKSRHLWIASGLVILVVLAQGIRRLLLQVSYLMVGSGKSDLMSPQLVFTETHYWPSYYLENFFGTENHLVLTGVFILGVAWVGRDWSLRFLYAFIILTITFMTNLLGYYMPHYVYYLLPIFLLAVASATVHAVDALPGSSAPRLFAVRAARGVAAAMSVGLVLAYATAYGLKLYDLSEDFRNPVRTDLRLDMAGIDYKGLAATLMEHYRPGDVVIAHGPLALRRYAGMDGDYFLETVTARKVIFDPSQKRPYYLDKYVGNPVLRSVEELEDVLYRHNRVWIYMAPYGGAKALVDKDVLALLREKTAVVHETFDAKLYLWKR